VTTATIGHNVAPTEATLALEVDALIRVADEWVAKVPKITDEETAAAARDFLAKLTAEATAVEEERTRQRKPHLDAAAAVQALFKPMADRLDIAKRRLLGIIDTWNKAEKARIEREKAATEKAKREAEAAAAEAALAAQAPNASIDDIVAAEEAQTAAVAFTKAASTAAKAKPAIRGNVATRALAEHTTWTAVIADYARVAAHFIAAGNTDLQAELQRLANAEARKSKEAFAIPGATVKKDTHL
jgi:hypothetical protein